jgi:DNA-binding MarR family transcriptional regulator
MNQLEDTVGFQLIHAFRVHRQSAEEALRELGLYAGQEMILFQLWHEEGLTPSHLAQQMRVEPPTMTQMLRRMEHAGFITRCQDSEDARISRVYLTERGRALEHPVYQVWHQLEERTLAGFSLAEQALLRRLLIQVRLNFS